MSAPRPHETNPFHPPRSVHVLTIAPISIYMQKFSTFSFHMVFTMCFGTVYIFHFHMRSCRNTLDVILSLIWYKLVCAIYPRPLVCNLHLYVSQYFTPGVLPAFYTDRSFDFILFACHAEFPRQWKDCVTKVMGLTSTLSAGPTLTQRKEFAV